jgi:hypothetical protein
VCEACATTAAQNVFFLVCEQGVICVRSLCNDSCPTCEDPAFKTSESGRDLLLVLTLECKTLGMVVARYRTPQNQCIEYGSGSAVIKVNWVPGSASDTDLDVSAFRIGFLLPGPDPVGQKKMKKINFVTVPDYNPKLLKNKFIQT